MSDVINFLLTKEVFIIFLLFLGIVVIYFIIWFRDYLKKMENKKVLQNNTLELNRLVEETRHAMQKESLPEVFKEKDTTIPEMLPTDLEKENIELHTDVMPTISNVSLSMENLEIEEVTKAEEQEVIEYKNEVYTEEEAKQELERLTEELQKEKEENCVAVLDDNHNISLTEFEIAQEENAIISLEELLIKGKELTSMNEVSQYKDEGNEPISIEELERRYQVERFEKTEEMPVITPEMVQELEDVKPKQEQISLFDMNSTPYQTASGYKPSPIISPIFGVEKEHIAQETRLELENTANYEKLDAQLQKTNEFLARLRELQGKLD